MNRSRSFQQTLLAAVAVAFLCSSFLLPNSSKTFAARQDKPSTQKKEDSLETREQRIRNRYKQFERTLQTMAGYLQKHDPYRAKLLRDAIKKSQEEGITQEMNAIVELFRNKQLGDALDQQLGVMKKLEMIMYILQREERLDWLREEQKRIKELIKDLNRLINKEILLRSKVERGVGDPQELAKVQEQIKKLTEKLSEKIAKQDAAKAGKPEPITNKDPNDSGKAKKANSKAGKGKAGKGKSAKSKAGKSKAGKSKAGKGKAGKGKAGKEKAGKGKAGKGKAGKGKAGKGKAGKGKAGKGKAGKGKQNKQQQGQQNQQSQERDQTPGREEIENAIEDMKRAIEELKKKDRDSASKDQDDAIEELEKALKELEDILKQLREEERELMLLALEARFQNMLRHQKEVRNSTVALNRIEIDTWTDTQRGQSTNQGVKEDGIALDAAKALMLLKEEGSSVAFPETVSQMRDDMLIVAARLKGFKANDLTILIENDIIEALEETLEAIKKALEDIQDKKGEPRESKPNDPPLVDLLAELKMLRSLQMRINRRTRRLGSLIEGDQATETDGDVTDQLRQLSRRQARIQEIAYDIHTGRNK